MTSKVKVNTVETESGSTLTLGKSGDTVTLASGASQSGFGRTGTVDWQTGSIKTANFTAASGEGYFANTTSSAFTMTLPSGSAGAIVSVQDYNNTFDTNSLTVAPATGEKINGGAASTSIVLNTQGQGVTFVYIDSTVGWRSVQDNVFDTAGSAYVVATGGTVTTSGDYKIHTFTGPGTFEVTSAGAPSGSNTMDYLVVGGGAAGGADLGGGGGAGGVRVSAGTDSGCWTSSPLGSCVSALCASVQSYPITVGAGGAPAAGAPNPSGGGKGGSGSNSIFSTITSAGGGGGGGAPVPQGEGAGANGGSGGGTSGYWPQPTSGGTGNTPPVSPPQGQNGGSGGGGGPAYPGAGGGGSGAAGTSPPNSSQAGGAGGNGVQINIDTNNYYWGAGGGGSAYNPSSGGNGGTGGGGGGGVDNGPSSGPAGSGGGSAINSGTGGNTTPTCVQGGAGGTNSGSGGGGGGHGGTSGIQPNNKGGSGGSGIVIIRYKFQN